MNLKEIFSLLAGLVFLAGFIPYVRAILKGETKPAIATWIVYAALDIVLLLGMAKENAVNGHIIGAVIGACIVMVLSFRYGKFSWSWIDAGSLAGGFIGIMLLLAGDAIISIQLMCAIGLIGSFPTFASAAKNPEDEDKTGWVLFWISCVFALMAIPQFTWQDAAQPITFMVIESTMMYLLFVHPRVKTRTAAA